MRRRVSLHQSQSQCHMAHILFVLVKIIFISVAILNFAESLAEVVKCQDFSRLPKVRKHIHDF